MSLENKNTIHLEVLVLRAVLTEAIAFNKFTHETFEKIFSDIDKAYKERDKFQNFIAKRDLMGDFLKEDQFGELDL
ncbi:hypothetical protein [Leptospira licerasiae]|uniref:hypothetical protein n=1 Tax=Leptospira licerasiae TaxID=447106 RepID=UPI0010829FC4|nr:hypothetical protein [Leptospira licerasiae]TGM87943.1 hypothetical protein EHR05_14940 [Leptospira licerasiae]